MNRLELNMLIYEYGLPKTYYGNGGKSVIQVVTLHRAYTPKVVLIHTYGLGGDLKNDLINI